MIIKSLSRTTGGAGSLVKYMFQDEKMKNQLSYQTRGGKLTPFSIRHLIKGETVEDWIEEFKVNQDNRKFKRKGMVLLYHEILSFASKDTVCLDNRVLSDITKKYIRLRSPDAPAIATIHYDVEHVHIHLALAGVKYKTGLANRVSKSEFASIKREMEAYQQEKYPELYNSKVQHGKGETKKSEAEFQMEKRAKKQSKREIIKARLDVIFSEVSNEKELWERLEKEGMPNYTRGKKVYGVTVGGRNYRFSTLGFSEQLESLQKEDAQLTEMDNLRMQESEKEKDAETSDRLKFLNNNEGKPIVSPYEKVFIRTDHLDYEK